MGTCNSLSYLALITSTPINVTLIAACMPVWMLAVGAIFYGTHPTRRQYDVGRIVLNAGDTAVLAPDAIHKIRNPHATPCLGLHVYCADLLSTERQMWNPHTGEELAMQPAQFDSWCDELTAAAAAAPNRPAQGW